MSTSSEKASNGRVSGDSKTHSAYKTVSENTGPQSKGGILQDGLQGTVDNNLTYFEQKAALINKYGDQLLATQAQLLTVFSYQ